MNNLKFNLSQCKIVAYEWKLKTPSKNTPVKEVSASTRLYLTPHLVSSVSFSKSLSSPSGSFEFQLDDSRNWGNIIKKESWCLIYMSNDGGMDMNSDSTPDSKYLRGICYIERVSKIETETEESGVREITYSVTGRDFGKIYEDAEVWLNPFLQEAKLIKGLKSATTFDSLDSTDKLIEFGHKLFFTPLQDIEGAKKFSDTSQQGLLPQELFKDLNLTTRVDGGTYLGLVKGLFQLSPTATTIPVANPLAAIQGNAWARLKEWAITPLHELFVETDSLGKPNLVYRAIPWGLIQSNYPVIRKFVKSYETLIAESKFTISGDEIISVEVGRDAHNRYNHFYAQTSLNRQSNTSNVSALSGQLSAGGREFPYADVPSIQRHGFRPMHLTINSLSYFPKKSKDAKTNRELLVEYNEVIYDYWAYAAYFETGSMTIVGSNKTKIGKAIFIDSGSQKGKAFYIEGYQDSVEIDPEGRVSWVQTLQLTRGVFRALLEAPSAKVFEEGQDNAPRGTFIKD